MELLTYTLLAEGGFDRALHRPIDWLLREHCAVGFRGIWADHEVLRAESRSLRDRMRSTLLCYESEVLIVHRDADAATRVGRLEEIDEAVRANDVVVPVVPVVPIHMTEAWLLHDEAAIRNAVGNPRGTIDLRLPRIVSIEAERDPKAILEDALIRASEATGRRLDRVKRRLARTKHLVAERIDDYSPLRALSGFKSFEDDREHALRETGAHR